MTGRRAVPIPAALGVVVWMAALAPAGAAGQTSGVDSVSARVEGTIYGRFQGGLRPLPFAVVEARVEDHIRSAIADSTGQYAVDGLPAGAVRLTARHTGHREIEVGAVVTAGRTLRLDIELQTTPVEVVGVDVSTDARAVDEREPGARVPVPAPAPTVEVRILEMGPGVAQAGLVSTVQSLPGQDPSDPSDVLFMRGSTTEMKLVLLDGVPVFTPFHVAGLMRSFEPSVLSSADLLVGGAPASYDGGLTHILDLRTRRARRDRVHASGSIDLMSATGSLEAPIGKRGGFLVSGRGLHDVGRSALGGPRPYGYQDVLASVDYDLTGEHQVAITAFDNRESILLDFPAGSSDAMWQNTALAARYRGRVGGADLGFDAGGSEYDAELPLRPTPRPYDPVPDAVLATAVTERVRFAAEVAWGDAEGRTRSGVSFEDLTASFAAQNVGSEQRAVRTGSTTILGAFGDATRKIAPGVTVRAGLRADLFGSSELRLGPRATVFWDVGPTALLTIAAGRYHQVAHAPQGEVDESLTDFANQEGVLRGPMPVAEADHVVLTLEQRLGESVSLGVEGFWKRFQGLETGSGDAVLNSGIDLRVLSAGPETAFWLGYGLSWFWSPLDLSGRATDFSGRHLLSAGLSGPLVGRIRGEARLSYGAGLPSTSLPFGRQDAAEPLAEESLGAGPVLSAGVGAAPAVDPSFLRVDVELFALFEPEVGGRPWRIRPYVRLLNALDQRDALFYTYQPWRSSSVTPLAERPIFPVAGLSFSF